MGDARTQSSSIPRPRVFQLLKEDEGNHPATNLRDAFVHGDNIYYLATESRPELSAGVWKIGCRTFDGKFVWRHRLPLGVYNGIGMSESGTPLLLSFLAYQGHPRNSVYSVVDVNTQPPPLEWLTTVPARAFLQGAHFGGVLEPLADLSSN
jgi:hypothetical protein